MADEGITVIIANGKRDNILVKIMNNEELNYTRFIPSPEPVSSIKKWIAHSEGFAKGELHINHCATELLFSDKAVSILPVGITDVIGEFEKDDIVRIIDFGGKPIGVGKANCELQPGTGNKGKTWKETRSALRLPIYRIGHRRILSTIFILAYLSLYTQ